MKTTIVLLICMLPIIAVAGEPSKDSSNTAPKEPKKESFVRRELKAAGQTIAGVFVAIGTTALVSQVHSAIKQ